VPAYFGECPGDIHTRVLERMRKVLNEDRQYPYLMGNAVARLEAARRSAQNSGAADRPLVCLGGNMWCLFPWLGTYAFFALERFLKRRCRDRLGLSSLDSSRPYFIHFKMKADPETFFEVLWDEAEKPIDPMELVYDGEVPLFEKYDEYVPASLVRKGFAYGILDIEGMLARIRSWKTQKERLF
jgi:ATP-dependent Lhr-like helicase